MNRNGRSTERKACDMLSLPMSQIITMREAMREIISTITSKGQVTIPAEVRKHLGLKTGDKVGFVIGDKGGRFPQSSSLPGYCVCSRRRRVAKNPALLEADAPDRPGRRA
jgi:AbrB family looped-hinge helix DNA binding protein